MKSEDIYMTFLKSGLSMRSDWSDILKKAKRIEDLTMDDLRKMCLYYNLYCDTCPIRDLCPEMFERAVPLEWSDFLMKTKGFGKLTLGNLYVICADNCLECDACPIRDMCLLIFRWFVPHKWSRFLLSANIVVPDMEGPGDGTE